MLEIAVMVGSSNSFVLQQIGDGGIFLPTVYERGTPGTFKPGRYIIGTYSSIQSAFLALVSHCIPVPQEDGAEVFRRETITFAGGEEELPRPTKKAKVNDTGTVTEGSAVSTSVRFFCIVFTDFSRS